jgi:hypothetical protein
LGEWHLWPLPVSLSLSVFCPPWCDLLCSMMMDWCLWNHEQKKSSLTSRIL